MKTRMAPIVLGALLILGSAGTASGAGTDIRFDGYCDGLHLEVPSVGLGTEYTVDGYQTGCVSGGVFGTAKGAGVGAGVQFVTIPGFETHTIIKKNGTWVHYGLNGNLITLVNRGTWSFGPPPAGSAPSSSVPSARARLDAADLGPLVTLDLMFDGYCDGMHLVNPSAGLPRKERSVDGNRTGCSSDPLMGSLKKINDMPGTYVVSFFADDTRWLQTAIFPDRTWIHFAVEGNTIYVLNSGTWSAAARARAGGARSSTR